MKLNQEIKKRMLIQVKSSSDNYNPLLEVFNINSELNLVQRGV